MNKSADSEMAPFSERLKEGMEKREKRQVDLCRDLDMKKATVSGYMSGAHMPDATTIGRIAKYLRVDPAWLTGYNISMESSVALSSEEMEIAVLYRNADAVSKEAVKRILTYYEKLSELRKE